MLKNSNKNVVAFFWSGHGPVQKGGASALYEYRRTSSLGHFCQPSAASEFSFAWMRGLIVRMSWGRS